MNVSRFGRVMLVKAFKCLQNLRELEWYRGKIIPFRLFVREKGFFCFCNGSESFFHIDMLQLKTEFSQTIGGVSNQKRCNNTGV